MSKCNCSVCQEYERQHRERYNPPAWADPELYAPKAKGRFSDGRFSTPRIDEYALREFDDLTRAKMDAMIYGTGVAWIYPRDTIMESAMSTAPTAAATVTHVKPIANPAIKLLAERLSSLKLSKASNQSIIDNYTSTLKTYTDKGETYGAEIGALAKALKKLGHKG